MTYPSATSSSARLKVRRIVPVVLSFLLLHVLLAMPDRIQDLTWNSLFRIPAELPAILLVLALARGLLGSWLRVGIVVLLAAVLVAKLADAATYSAFGRPFDLVLDLHLLRSAWDLLAGTYGAPGALLALAAILIGLAVIGAVLAWAIRNLARGTRHLGGGGKLALVALLAVSLGGIALGWSGATANASANLAGQFARAHESLGDLQRFRSEAAVDPLHEIPSASLLSALRGRDVLVVFFESDGASVLTDPVYRTRTEQALARFDEVIARKGMSARSAFLRSTTMGGQSWFAHSSLLAGLRIDNQRRYETLVRGEHGSLVSDFHRAGWTTLAVMPAITRDWPEGAFYGFDRIYAANDLGYRGKPFDWITMPDQFTLAAFERLKDSSPDRAPVMAQITLLSSHFPWAPLPRQVDWAAVGDGTVFDAQVAAGDKPDVVWRDSERVRRNYLASIEYVLGTLSSYVEHFGGDRLVMIILGDHPPIPWVAGDSAGRSVPIYMIAGDPSVIARLDGWRWTNGMKPSEDAPKWPMESFRGRLVTTFSKPVGEVDDASHQPR